MLRKGESAVRTALQNTPEDANEISDEILFRLAEERGLNPEMVVSIASRLGWKNLSVRVGFSADMASRNAERTKKASKTRSSSEIFHIRHLPKTSLDYYKDTGGSSFEAKVIECNSLSETQISNLNLSSEVSIKPTHFVVLDRTLFYPEGGGQLGDQGSIGNVRVVDTRIEQDVVIHLTDGEISTGDTSAKIDAERRIQLMDHHSSVHIVGGSARAILGPHIWQAGSSKGSRYARIDLTHYSRLNREDLDAIEDHANLILENDIEIEKLVMDRDKADEEFGFELYQGGPPKHSQIRVIRVGDHDVQACGGTHHDKTGKIGELRIIRSSQVQDGVERLHIVAGETAREHSRSQERIIAETSQVLGVSAEELPSTVSRFFEEWKTQQKKIESLEAEIVRLRTSGNKEASVQKEGIRYVIMEVEGDMRAMMTMLGQLTRDSESPTLAVLGSREGGGMLIVACTEDSIVSEKHNSVEILSSISHHINGGGGGSPTMAQGGGSNSDGIPESLDSARELLGL